MASVVAIASAYGRSEVDGSSLVYSGDEVRYDSTDNRVQIYVDNEQNQYIMNSEGEKIGYIKSNDDKILAYNSICDAIKLVQQKRF